jgi:hypothetical protein
VTRIVTRAGGAIRRAFFTSVAPPMSAVGPVFVESMPATNRGLRERRRNRGKKETVKILLCWYNAQTAKEDWLLLAGPVRRVSFGL